ncbi:metallophosphoesterase [Neolewinella antarctica]|uniref:Calcineurin-like phosphoesterase domain-containing protein n=1 Tax=Neolewinella antarctica TaxID=442734 RepID=A0ABX0XEJ6_9BACT|nr:metallophosphoesterase [Neolewinella antarctica]NJC27642.1 hypothetical protein [Neolewinella antarctica]
MQDLIGDIHGHATHLKALLAKLGYAHDGHAYRHPERTVVFLGDYIDRGPENPEVLRIVREMTEAGTAVALMGNHEFNALAFNTRLKTGGYLRPHLIKNIKQHAETLMQFQNRQAEYFKHIEWMKTLPLCYETEHFRAVHASWHQPSMDHLRHTLVNNRLTEAALLATADEFGPTNDAIEKVLKGLELPLPAGTSFLDKDGTERHHIRYRWWENPVGATYTQLGIHPDEGLREVLYAGPDSVHYGEAEKPVFFGHYWLKGVPEVIRGNICCLDFSVAKGGYLAGYRFDGEKKLVAENLVWV